MLRATLQAIITRGYADGRQHYGDLGLSMSAYADRLISIVEKHVGVSSSVQEAVAFADRLHGRDLYLATACARHNPGSSGAGADSERYAALAWRTLEEAYKSFVCDLVRFFHGGGFAVRDLADNIFTDLYLPDRSGSSRIASYDGRSSLSTWLRVVICNRVINMQRSIAFSKTTDIAPDLPDGLALHTIESVLRVHRYQSALRDSIEFACRQLTSQERLMILWRYQDGLQLGQIARLLGIHQSNVTRQLTRLQSKLRDEVIAVLGTAHGLSKQAIQECIEDVIENPRHEISILDLIKNSADSMEGKKAATSPKAKIHGHSKQQG